MSTIMHHSTQDVWGQWLLHRRHGGDAERMQLVLDSLYPVRDKVLSHTNLSEGDTLLDVGCGDGLIAFGALEKEKTCKVIFTDVSQDLLTHAQSVAQKAGESHRCQFIEASASDLHPIKNSSVDAVTTRSVLIYVEDKQQAFREFYRVLKSRGRLSIFEPINRFNMSVPAHRRWGYDMTPVKDIWDKVQSIYSRLQPPESDPMMNFDERDLVVFAEQAGFSDIHLELQVVIKPSTATSWDVYAHTAANPKIPTLEEIMQQALTPNEIKQLTACLRPLVESGQGVTRSAVAYLWAIKP